ncbi:hypothetical protein B0H34DRAFT_422786 [Crassisporium funariophilum]|nr:hypothetical protein B0H34DRAFT_422786 [Crassisporium funariophilum]
MKGCLKLTSPIPSPGLHGEFNFLPLSHPSSSSSCNSSSSSSHSSPHHSHPPSRDPSLPSSGASSRPHSPSRSHSGHQRKCVMFGGAEGCVLETVYTADEWDRTPTEPARKLSYQDLLELKEIQRSLPRANQPADYLSGRPSRHFLKGVPIGLLPLVDSPSASENASVSHSGASSGCQSPMGGSESPLRGGSGNGSPRSSSPPRPFASSWIQPPPPPPTPTTPTPTPTPTTSTSTSTPTTTSPWCMNFQSKRNLLSPPSSSVASLSSSLSSSLSPSPSHSPAHSRSSSPSPGEKQSQKTSFRPFPPRPVNPYRQNAYPAASSPSPSPSPTSPGVVVRRPMNMAFLPLLDSPSASPASTSPVPGSPAASASASPSPSTPNTNRQEGKDTNAKTVDDVPYHKKHPNHAGGYCSDYTDTDTDMDTDHEHEHEYERDREYQEEKERKERDWREGLAGAGANADADATDTDTDDGDGDGEEAKSEETEEAEFHDGQ